MRLDARWVVALLWCAMGLFASGSASGAAGEPSGELIARSQITTTGEPSCTLVQAPLAKDKLDALSEMLRQDIADGRIPGAGLAIHQAGKRVYTFAAGRVGHNRDGAVGRHTRFRLFSMTKPLISVAVLQLVEAGRLKLSDPLTRYLPVFSNIRLEGPGGTWLPASGPITIRDLLRHTSGLPYGFFGRGRVREILKAAELYRGGRTAEETMVVLVKAGLEHSPGSVWEYGHSNTVLAAVLEAIHQKPLADVLHASLFAPLAMTSTSFFVPTAVPDDVVAGTPN
ncbi:MAG: CubicO group peptidase (beta-lactamase class C family), partial [Gammaproteobacteria bacterium]